MKMMKIGVIGTGGRGHNAWQTHKPEQGWEIVAGADIKQKAREEFKEKFPGADVFNDYRGRSENQGYRRRLHLHAGLLSRRAGDCGTRSWQGSFPRKTDGDHDRRVRPDSENRV